MTAQILEKTASAGVADTLTQPALSDAEQEAAFLTELTGEDDTAATIDQTEEAEQADYDSEVSDESDDESEAEEVSDEETEAEEEAQEDEEEKAEDKETEDEEEEPDFSALPKEAQALVGKLLKKTREKERAKMTEKLAELETVTQDRASLLSERARLTGELEQLQASKSVPSPTNEDPFADVFDVGEVSRREQELWSIRDRLISEPDAIQITDSATGEKRYLEDSEVRQRLALVDRRLQRDLPKRKEWLQKHEQWDTALRQAIPEVDKADSLVARGIAQVVTTFPAIKTLPGYRNAALAQVMGQQLLAAYGAQAFAELQNLVTKARTTTGKPGAPKPSTASLPKRAPKPPKATIPPSRPVRKDTPTGRLLTDEEFYEGLADDY